MLKFRQSKAAVRNRRRHHSRQRLAVELLEDRRLLAVVLPELGTGSIGSSLTRAGFSSLLSSIPSSNLNSTPPGDTSVLYHAFPQEANNVNVRGDLLNLFLYLNEQNDEIFVQRSLPAFNDDLLEDFNFTLEFIAGVEIPVAHLLGLDFPDVEAIVPNPGALTQFLPQELQDVVDSAAQVLGTTIFPALKIGELQLTPSLSVGGLLGSVIPGPVDDLILQIISLLEGGGRGGILMDLLDGNDRADLSELSGVVQDIRGGVGDDVLLGGGTDDPLVVLGSTSIGAPSSPRIELSGGPGRDTFVVNNRFNVNNYRVHGGSGNDLLLVPGTDLNDVIHVYSDASGLLDRIEFRQPSSTGGVARSEIQTITLPAGVSGGTFQLLFNGQLTSPIAANATPAVVEAALEALSSISGVTVGGSPGAWEVTFDGPGFANADQPNLAANGSALVANGAEVIVTQTVVGGSANFNEVQRVQVPSSITDGTFVLRLPLTGSPNQDTVAISVNADASAVRAALAALPAIGDPRNVNVTRDTADKSWTIEFTGALAGTNLGQLQVINTSLVGIPPSASSSELTAGVTQRNEIQTVTVSSATGGALTLSFGGFVTSPAIPHNGSALTVENLLAALPSIGAGNVSVTGTPGNWAVEFTGSLAGTNVPSLIVNGAGLIGAGAAAAVSTTTTAQAGVNERQSVTYSNSVNGGTFELSFRGETTSAIPHNATANQVRAELGALSTIGAPENIEVTKSVGSNSYQITFVNDLGLLAIPQLTLIDAGLLASPGTLNVSTLREGGTPVNDVQTIALPANVTDGTFNLTVGGVAVPSPTSLPFNATAAQVESYLELSAALSDVRVTGPVGGPWQVEFLAPGAGTPGPAITGNGAGLERTGIGLLIAETQSGGSGGEELIVTTTFAAQTEIEQLRFELGNGDDRIVFFGAPNFPQGVFVDAGDGTDDIEMRSTATSPRFEAPLFADSVAATLQFDGQAIQFADVEGGVTFDAGGQAGAEVFVAGTDTGNDIRFRSLGAGQATFANDEQVTLSLNNFGASSEVQINGEQGDDTITVFLNGDTTFSRIIVAGGGPNGADSFRVEGSANVDTFTLTPDAADPKAGIIESAGGVQYQFADIDALTFVGGGGIDALTVNEPTAGNDLVLFNPEVGNGGSFQWTTQTAGPETAIVYPVVRYESIETRTFDTGTGTDGFVASTSDLPGVNSSVTVDGGNGTATIFFGDQATNLVHDTSATDTVSLEIGTSVDDITVTPGVGVIIAVNSAEGADSLAYNSRGNATTWDISSRTIREVGFGDVTYTAVESLQLRNQTGVANSLQVLGTSLDETIIYTPLSATAGLVSHSGPFTPSLSFEGYLGTLTIDTLGGAADTVAVEGTNLADRFIVDTVPRRVQVRDQTGNSRKAVVLGSGVEIAEAAMLEGDDQILVIASSGSALTVEVIGGGPHASDQLVVQDDGAGDLIIHRESRDLTGGSILVGELPQISYQDIERVDILPLNPITGGTGNNDGGRIVVFHADPFEQNDSLVNATEVPDLFQSTVKANIGVPGQTNPFATGLNLPGDEDWYRFRAPKVGTFSFEVLFDRIANLPGNGELVAEVYRKDGSLIVSSTNSSFGDVVSFSAARLEDYFLQVRGATTESINVYEVNLIEVDLVGPQVFDPDGGGVQQAIQITGNPGFNLFDIKDSAGNFQGPTPLVKSLTINMRDMLNRIDQLPADLSARLQPNGRAPGDLSAALDTLVNESFGSFEVRGDSNGIIEIVNIRVTNATPVVGQIATGQIELVFANPLPDDRFTLTIRDMVQDPAENGFDGPSNAAEPNGGPVLPSGNNSSGGPFIARFTVDSRAELGVWALGSVYTDTNGNFEFDEAGLDRDFTNKDIVYKLGFQTDSIFAGNFVAAVHGIADGYDKLGAYGLVAGQYRWLIDTNNNGVPDLVVIDPAQINGRPIAGNFDGNRANGDEVGLKQGNIWHLDTNHDFRVDTQLAGDMVGLPIVGDFDGDGIDDLGAWADDVFSLDLSADGIDGFTDAQFTFGFPGVREIPIAADFNGDGIDDIGLSNPDAAGTTPGEIMDWQILLSQKQPNIGLGPITFGGNTQISTTVPFGSLIADELIPVDPQARYSLSTEGRSGDGSGGQYQANNLQYVGFASFDADQLRIERWHVQKHRGATDTRLAIDLLPGATQVVLEDASGWANSGPAKQRSLAWFGYANSTGFIYPDYTYTRNVLYDQVAGAWASGGIVGNTITLNKPWNGPALAAGTAMRNATSGFTFNYPVLLSAPVADQWTTFGGVIEGVGEAQTQFRPGTAFIKPFVLSNHQGGTQNLISFRNFNLQRVRDTISVVDRIIPDPLNPSKNIVQFTPQPFGPDIFAHFGDAASIPVVGNFDPPLVPEDFNAAEVSVVALGLQNASQPMDVNGDGFITPMDALAVINYLENHGATSISDLRIESTSVVSGSAPMYDVNGDSQITALDVLRVVNWLNRQASSGEGELGGPIIDLEFDEQLEETMALIAESSERGKRTVS